MMLTDLSKMKKKVVGFKQTLNVINNGKAEKVFLAEDVDQNIKQIIQDTSNKNNIIVIPVESKMRLGRACGIDVSAACAAILK